MLTNKIVTCIAFFKVFGSYDVYDVGSLSYSKADSFASVSSPRDHTAATLNEDIPTVSQGEEVVKSKDWQKRDHCCVIDFVKEKRNVVFETKLKEMFDSVKTQTAKENLLLSLRLLYSSVYYS